MIRKVTLAASLCFGLPFLTQAAHAKDADAPYAYGTPPDWDRYKALGEAAVRAALPASANAIIEWPNGYRPWFWKHEQKSKIFGYTTCGAITANGVANSYYDEIRSFVIVIDHDQVQALEFGGKMNGAFVRRVCPYLEKGGFFPRAADMERQK